MSHPVMVALVWAVLIIIIIIMHKSKIMFIVITVINMYKVLYNF